MGWFGTFGQGVGAVCLALALGNPAAAQDAFTFTVIGGDDDLSAALRAASSVRAARNEDTTEAQDLFAAARAEYGRLLAALYAQGHYSGVVNVRIDGREAADIAALDAPTRIGRIEVIVDPGPAFLFGMARVAPLPARTASPPEFATGQPALSGQIAIAVDAGIDGWRDRGHAKARVTSEDIVADHARRTLSADVALNPGPKLRFGQLSVSGQQRMRLERILAIAGLPEGRAFSPRALDRVAERLRRTGVFKSVALTESDTITAPDLLPIGLAVVEEKLRRYSFGAELSSLDGVTVSGAWLHRNLFGGAERLRIAAEVAQIGAQSSGTDYSLGVTLDRPATITPDTTLSGNFDIAHLEEDDYIADTAGIGFTFTQYISRRLTARAGLQYSYSAVDDITGDYTYRNLALPIGATWDSRDKPLDARKGVYLDAEIKPFLGFGTTDSGLRATADARVFRSVGEDDRVTFAARAQVGAVFGAGLLRTPRGDLFYSGGGGTVRGQPYQSLGVSVLQDDFKIGGQAFLGASLEARVRVTKTIGVVAFADWGQIGGLDFNDDLGGEHAGAGLGLRYDTGFGPIRLDVATPISGNTGKGVQIYIGIGQAF